MNCYLRISPLYLQTLLEYQQFHVSFMLPCCTQTFLPLSKYLNFYHVTVKLSKISCFLQSLVIQSTTTVRKYRMEMGKSRDVFSLTKGLIDAYKPCPRPTKEGVSAKRVSKRESSRPVPRDRGSVSIVTSINHPRL